MPIFLRQSTASQEVTIGQFVDSTDGFTAETALTIANTDLRLWKNGTTTLVNKNSGGATHIAIGIYSFVLDATDTNTVGPMIIYCSPTGARPQKLHCVVMPANVFDSLIAGSAVLSVNATQFSGDAVAADNAEAFFDGTGYNGPNNTIGTVTNLTNKGNGSDFTSIPWNAAWDAEVQSECADALNVYDPPTNAELVAEINSVQADVSGVLTQVNTALTSISTVSTQVSGVSTQVTNVESQITGLNNISAAQVNAEVDTALSDVFLDFATAGIVDLTAKFDAFEAQFDDLIELDGSIYRFTTDALEQAPGGGSGPSAVDIANEVQTRTIAAVNLVNGLANNVITAAATAADFTTEIQSGLVQSSQLPVNFADLSITATTGRVSVGTNNDKTGYSISGTITTLDSLDTAQDTQHAQTRTVIGTPTGASLAADVANVQIAADSAATPAEVNLEIVDALATDLYSESSAVVGASATIADSIRWMKTLSRNEITQTATTQTLKNNSGAGNIATAAVSDDSTTFTRGKFT